MQIFVNAIAICITLFGTLSNSLAATQYEDLMSNSSTLTEASSNGSADQDSLESGESLGNLLGRYQDRVVLERAPFPAPPEELVEVSKVPGFRSGRGIYNLLLLAPDNSRYVVQTSLLDDVVVVFQVDPQGNASQRKLKSFTTTNTFGTRMDRYYFEDGYELNIPPAWDTQAPVGLVPSRKPAQ